MQADRKSEAAAGSRSSADPDHAGACDLQPPGCGCLRHLLGPTWSQWHGGTKTSWLLHVSRTLEVEVFSGFCKTRIGPSHSLSQFHCPWPSNKKKLAQVCAVYVLSCFTFSAPGRRASFCPILLVYTQPGGGRAGTGTQAVQLMASFRPPCSLPL